MGCHAVKLCSDSRLSGSVMVLEPQVILERFVVGNKVHCVQH